VSIGFISHRLKLVLAALMLTFAHCAVAAPPATAPAASPSMESQASEESRRLLQLGPGDSVTLSVFGQPDLATTTFVGDDGSLTVPLAGPVPVSGLSPGEAARRVEKALKDGKYLVDPHVTISAVVSRSQRVSVIGEVSKPGRYVIEPNIAIFDLLAEAGGVTENASDTIDILRTDKDGNVVRHEINLKGMARGDLTAEAQTLKAGDSIFVPRADQFYIYGEVTTPGKYRVEPGMTVIQAIARAGGITIRGSQRRVEIKRQQDDGKSFVTFKPKLDDRVRAEDVIRVKESIF
jgi:polysaccharide export outer membrane protein